MSDTHNVISVSFNVKELETFLDLHIDKAISRAIETLEKQHTTSKRRIEWITRKEAVAILGISMPTLHNWSKTGIIPGYRIGSLVRYKRSEIDEAFKLMRTSNSRRR